MVGVSFHVPLKVSAVKPYSMLCCVHIRARGSVSEVGKHNILRLLVLTTVITTTKNKLCERLYIGYLMLFICKYTMVHLYTLTSILQIKYG